MLLLSCLTLLVLVFASPPSPHILLLVLDDVGWADVGFHGSDFRTPHIDALASEGVDVGRVYVQPQCTPTRASLLTGRHASSLGLQHWTTILPSSEAALPLDVPTRAEELRSTHAIGKWHLGYARPRNTPTGRGFDTFYGMLNGGADYRNRTFEYPSDGAAGPSSTSSPSPFGGARAAFDCGDGSVPAVNDFGTYAEDSFVDRAEELVRSCGGREECASGEEPLFLYFSPQLLHTPIHDDPGGEGEEHACPHIVPSASLPSARRSALCAMASRLDASVGRLVGALVDAGMYNDSLVWLVSDNGGMPAVEVEDGASPVGGIGVGSASSNWPLRGGKGTLFEGGIRAVSVVGGGVVPAHARGAERLEPVHAVDVAPTLLGRALGADGAARAAGAPKDGLDVWEYVADGAPMAARREAILINAHRGRTAYLYASFDNEGEAEDERDELDNSAIVAWPWKLIVGDVTKIYPADALGYWTVSPYEWVAGPDGADEAVGAVRLYNLERDEAETTNLALRLPSQVARLHALLRDWATGERYRAPQRNVPLAEGHPLLSDVAWTVAPFLPD